MLRRPRFIPGSTAREWAVILLGGAALGLLLVWLQEKFQLNLRVVRLVLMAVAGLVLLRCVLLVVAYVKELRREEEEWGAAKRTPTE